MSSPELRSRNTAGSTVNEGAAMGDEQYNEKETVPESPESLSERENLFQMAPFPESRFHFPNIYALFGFAMSSALIMTVTRDHPVEKSWKATGAPSTPISGDYAFTNEALFI